MLRNKIQSKQAHKPARVPAFPLIKLYNLRKVIEALILCVYTCEMGPMPTFSGLSNLIVLGI